MWWKVIEGKDSQPNVVEEEVLLVVLWGVRMRIVIENEGFWVSMSLANSIMEFKCPFPRAGYRTKVSFMVEIEGILDLREFLRVDSFFEFNELIMNLLCIYRHCVL